MNNNHQHHRARRERLIADMQQQTGAVLWGELAQDQLDQTLHALERPGHALSRVGNRPLGSNPRPQRAATIPLG